MQINVSIRKRGTLRYILRHGTVLDAMFGDMAAATISARRFAFSLFPSLLPVL
ncbi:MAG: hypothetical protein ACJ74J_14650 [Blastocatellia bacterium]